MANFKKKVDYNQVRSFLNENDFSNASRINQKLDGFNLKLPKIPEGKELTREQLQKAHELQVKYLVHFEKNNFSLNQINNYPKNEFLEFDKVSDKIVEKSIDDKVVTNNFHHNELLFSKLALTSSDEASRHLTSTYRGLNNSDLILTSISVAAGLGAAIPGTFGATAPGATTCTLISTVCGIIDAIVGTAKNIYDDFYSKGEVASETIDVFEVGREIYVHLYEYLLKKGFLLRKTMGAFSPVVAVISLIDLSIKLVEYFE